MIASQQLVVRRGRALCGLLLRYDRVTKRVVVPKTQNPSRYVLCLERKPMRAKCNFAVVSILILLLLVSCASQPSYEEAFSTKHQVPGSVETLPVSVDVAWSALLEVISRQGFLVQQANSKSHLILANRDIRDAKDNDLSYTVSATITLIPLSDQMTRVLVAANQTTEMHRKEYRWWKLLWILPIFPVGSEYTTVVVNRDTVRSPQFYQDLFAATKGLCEEKIPIPQQSVGE